MKTQDWEELVADARHYREAGYTFEFWEAEYGWDTWMEEFTAAKNGEEATESECKAISTAMRAAWTKAAQL